MSLPNGIRGDGSNESAIEGLKDGGWPGWQVWLSSGMAVELKKQGK